MALIVIGLYGWTLFGGRAAPEFRVSDIVAILAGLTAVISAASYFWVPHKHVLASTYVVYILLIITIALLVFSTGGVNSAFVALWMLAAIFAGVFGWYGLVPLFLAATGYMVWQYSLGSIDRADVIVIALAGELPLAISYLIWHTKSTTGDSRDRAFRELASELSQVSGKAEVVINAIADGVIALDNSGTIQLINPAAQRIIGWGKQDALALKYTSVLKLVDTQDSPPQPAIDPVTQALGTNKSVRTDQLRLVTNSGKKLQISIVVSPIGQPGSGVIVVFRDITAEKAEEREQAEFISTASHEMRTPVASIEGYLGLALNPQTAQIDDKAREFITKAHQSAQHLGRLFQDLLDVTKAEDGRLGNNPQVVDVVAFIGEIVDGLKPKADEKSLRMLFKPAPDGAGSERRISPVFYVNVDNDHLREVIANLVENAIKYTPSGDVVVDVTGDNDHVTVSVTDSGIGIPKEDQSHLFQKFYRVDNSDTRTIGGTGLGLYLCRRLTEAMNGRIWVESEYKQGSTFYVELPRVEHEEAIRMIESSADQPATASTATPAIPAAPQPAPAPQPAAAQSPQPAHATPTQPTQPAAPPQPTPAQPPARQTPVTPAQPVQPATPPVQPPATAPVRQGIAIPPRPENKP